jgi:hypothetical protein
MEQRLQTETFTAFGTTSSDDCTTTTGFHAGQETVGTGATGFGRLISTFHDGKRAKKAKKAKKAKEPKSGKALDYRKKTSLKSAVTDTTHGISRYMTPR